MMLSNTYAAEAALPWWKPTDRSPPVDAALILARPCDWANRTRKNVPGITNGCIRMWFYTCPKAYSSPTHFPS